VVLGAAELENEKNRKNQLGIMEEACISTIQKRRKKYMQE